MLDCKPVTTPIVPGQDKKSGSSDDVIESKDYQEIIGELLYISNRSRPDITFATSYLSQFNTLSERHHYIMAKRVLRYLSGTLNYKLRYDREEGRLNGSSELGKWNQNEIFLRWSNSIRQIACNVELS